MELTGHVKAPDREVGGRCETNLPFLKHRSCHGSRLTQTHRASGDHPLALLSKAGQRESPEFMSKSRHFFHSREMC